MKKILFVFFTMIVFFISCETPMNAPTIKQRSVDLSKTEKPKLLLVGDSRVEQFPSSYFIEDWDVYNIGLSGSTSQFAAFSIYIQQQHFDTIIISSGINDYHEGISPGNTVTYLNIAIGWAKQKADNVFLTTIPGMMYNGTSKSYNVSLHAAQANLLIPTIAANNSISYIPLANLLCTGWFLKAEYTFDGIHYNIEGYDATYNLYENYIQETEE